MHVSLRCSTWFRSQRSAPGCGVGPLTAEGGGSRLVAGCPECAGRAISASRLTVLCALSLLTHPVCFVFQLQGLNDNVILTLESLLEGDLKEMKGVSVENLIFTVT